MSDLGLPDHRPPGAATRAPRWVQAMALVLAAAASLATSRPEYRRGYAVWTTFHEPTISLGCAQASLWIVKSGKQGVGANLRLVFSDPTCAVQLEEAHLQLPDGPIPVARPLPMPIVAGADSPPIDGLSPAALSGESSHEAYVYLPFPFDENAVWNSGLKTAPLSLRLRASGRTTTWTIPLRHVYEGHRVKNETAYGPGMSSVQIPPPDAEDAP